MSIAPLLSPHIAADDPADRPTLENRVYNVEIVVTDHGKQIAQLDTRLPFRRVERALLAGIFILMLLDSRFVAWSIRFVGTFFR